MQIDRHSVRITTFDIICTSMRTYDDEVDHIAINLALLLRYILMLKSYRLL